MSQQRLNAKTIFHGSTISSWGSRIAQVPLKIYLFPRLMAYWPLDSWFFPSGQLLDQVFEVLSKYGVGQILSHWTWLPPLRKQLAKANGKFFNAGNECVIRLMTPLNMKYETAYAKAYPFDQIVEGMLQPEMIFRDCGNCEGCGWKRCSGEFDYQ